MSSPSSSSSASSPPSPKSPSNANKSISGNKDGRLQIFLGGSCNPTTWRQNVAIPYLEMNGITYYNPQVDNWTPEVVNSERYAKQNAQILLFVIDKQTRSTVSLVESAFMAGDNKNLVLVIYPFEYNIVSLSDTSKQTSNVVETRSRTTNHQNLNARQNESSCLKSSSSTSSSTLISSSSEAHESNLTSTRVSSKTTLTSSKINSTTNAENCKFDTRRLKEIHEEAKQASGAIKMSDEVISLGEFQELRQARYILQNLVAMRKIPMFPDIHQALNYVSRFLNDGCGPQLSLKCCLRQNSNNAKDESHSLNLLDHEYSLLHTPTNDQKPTNDDLSGDIMKDVYLSLDSDDHTSVESTVIPILEEKGLTYNYMSVTNVITSSAAVIMPKLSIDSQMPTSINEFTKHSSALDSGENTRLAIEKEVCAIRSSRVLLFVITNKCRGLSIMVLASHFMALFRKNVVLCVQYLEEPCSIGDETLTKAAIADYNRGRVYLSDYANKSQVPVFSTIREAIECCSRKCRHNN